METEPTFPHCYGVGFNPTYAGTKYACSICMVETVVDDDESNNRLAHFNNCTHTACISCLTTWMESGRYDCPECRTHCDGIQTVCYTLHMANNEYMLLGEEIVELQHNIEERIKSNTILRHQLVFGNIKIERLESRYGHYGCNDQDEAVLTMEETAGILDIPQRVRKQENVPEVFLHADRIRKTHENDMVLKTNFIEHNISRNTFELQEIHSYKQRQRMLISNAQMLLSSYSAQAELVDETFGPGIGMEIDPPNLPSFVNQSSDELILQLNNVMFDRFNL